MSDHPVPTAQARELVRGGFDPYVHAAPDFAPRRITDLELAERCLELGLAGFGVDVALHGDGRAGRGGQRRGRERRSPSARSCSTTRSAGLNATAVEVAARQGARFVWLPTVSATGEFAKVEGADANGNVPVWVRFERELRAAGCGRRARAGARRGRRAAARAARGARRGRAARARARDRPSVARRRSFAVVDAAVAAGVETIVVTNPEFPSHKLSPDDQVALAERGALFQRALTTPYTGKCTWDELFAATRAVGAARTVWG